jgi:hypothetical protein
MAVASMLSRFEKELLLFVRTDWRREGSVLRAV